MKHRMNETEKAASMTAVDMTSADPVDRAERDSNGYPVASHGESGVSVANRGKVGVLLVALGTPDAPTPSALRRYLKEFLSDPRVIEVPRLLWLPILYGPILTFRPKKSAHAYGQIWDTERNESPLRTITRDQSDALAALLAEQDTDQDILVDWAFRYGQPSIEDKIKDMHNAGVDKLLIFSLYPQYSASTVASVNDKVYEVLSTMRWQPTLRTVPVYYDQPSYIEALAGSVKDSLDGLDWTPEHILASYHSIPQAYWDKGDPYPCQCFKTTRLLGEALDMTGDYLQSSFQSRVGPSKWVGPYSDKKVEQLAKSGVKKLAILAPAFSADCVETLEEINIGLRETFMEHGGTHFHYIPCLNAAPDGMVMLKSLVEKELAGWI